MVRVGDGAGHQCEQDKSACGFTHHFFSSLRSTISDELRLASLSRRLSAEAGRVR
jgi:hypothetical protein